jgi:hypothetical protein
MKGAARSRMDAKDEEDNNKAKDSNNNNNSELEIFVCREGGL